MTLVKITQKNKSISIDRKTVVRKNSDAEIGKQSGAAQSTSVKTVKVSKTKSLKKQSQKHTQKHIVKEKQYFTYMVRCSDDTLYTGWTTDLQMRVRAHNGYIKGGAKYTKSKRPVKLVWFDSFDVKEEAQRREYAVKQLSRAEKLALIASIDDTDTINEANTL